MALHKKLEGQHPVNMKKYDTKEFDFPETVFISDIDPKLLQGIALQCLAKIDGVAVVEGTFIDSIFGRGGTEKGASIHAEQDSKNQTVSIKVEVNIRYGVSIPQKAEEIHSKLVKEITELTGLHVASVQVLFRGLIPDTTANALQNLSAIRHDALEEPAYSDDF
jgi:uncharacterized alkaline shock family protein YloU